MKTLFLSSVFPPRIIGGAELNAYNLALWFRRQGHEVGVLTVAAPAEEELRGQEVEGLRMWRIKWPRVHTLHEHSGNSALAKMVWHLEEHFDPRNRSLVDAVIREFKPEVIQIHVQSGFGHNAIRPADFPQIPFVYTLHDMTLACTKTCMFKNEQNCVRPCGVCGVSSQIKMRHLRGCPNVVFISSSHAHLKTCNDAIDLSEFPCHVIGNVDLTIPVPRKPGIPGEPPRLIYIGRIDKRKGVPLTLGVLRELAGEGLKFHVKVIGTGPEEDELRKSLSNQPWVSFLGKIPHQEVVNHLSNSDLLLVPSVWRENYPGVVREALRAGVPPVVSDAGGIKEMIVDGESGVVVKAGDKQAWKAALKKLLPDDQMINKLQQGAVEQGRRYSADDIGRKTCEVLLQAKERLTATRFQVAGAPQSPKLHELR